MNETNKVWDLMRWKSPPTPVGEFLFIAAFRCLRGHKSDNCFAKNLVWDSDDSLDGAYGTDFDILVARGQFEPWPIPSVSEWGLVAMTLLVLTAGTLVYARRRAVHS